MKRATRTIEAGLTGKIELTRLDRQHRQTFVEQVAGVAQILDFDDRDIGHGCQRTRRWPAEPADAMAAGAAVPEARAETDQQSGADQLPSLCFKLNGQGPGQ